MRTALFLDLTERVVVIPYRSFGKPLGLIFRSQKSKLLPGYLTLEVGTDKSSRNVGKELPLLAV